MAEEARAKAAAATRPSAAMPTPGFAKHVIGHWIEKPLLAAVPKRPPFTVGNRQTFDDHASDVDAFVASDGASTQSITRTASGEWRVDVDQRDAWLDRQPERTAAKALAMLLASRPGEYVGWLARNARFNALRVLEAVAAHKHITLRSKSFSRFEAPGCGTLIVATEEVRLRGYRFVDGIGLPPYCMADFGRREYSFPNKPVLPPNRIADGDSLHLAGAAADVSSMEAVFKREADRIVARAKREMEDAYKRMLGEVYRAYWSEPAEPYAGLKAWLPQTKPERVGFWGPSIAELLDKLQRRADECASLAAPSWHVVSNPSDVDVAEQFADKVRAARWWEPMLSITKYVGEPPRLIADPLCPPSMAYVMAPPKLEPLEPDDYQLKVTAKFATPSYVCKIKLPEDG